MFGYPKIHAEGSVCRRGSQPRIDKSSLAAAFHFTKHGVHLVSSVVIVTAILAGWLIGCAGTASSGVLVDYRRSGGFAGLDDHLIIDSSGQATLTRQTQRYEFALDSDTVDRLVALLDSVGFSKLCGEHLPSHQGSDLFEYVVTYEGQTVRTMDIAVPESLQPVLELLNQIVESGGKPESPALPQNRLCRRIQVGADVLP